MLANRYGAPWGALVREVLAPYTDELSDQQVLAIERYATLLVQWNQKISLTSVREPRRILSRHFGESLFATKIMPLVHGRLADVGSGAGFPGLALKIACPELEVLLIEANHKKVAFLAEVKRALQLRGVEIFAGRLEDLQLSEGRLNFVSARAIGNVSGVLPWALGGLRPDGSILLWLGKADAEKVAPTRGWLWREPIVIPDSLRRVILVGDKA